MRNFLAKAWNILNADIGVMIRCAIELIKRYPITVTIMLLASLTGVVFVYLVMLSYILWYPFAPIRVDKILLGYQITTNGENAFYPFANNKAEVGQGDELCFKFEGEKFMAIPVHVVIELVNGEGIAIMSYDSNNPPGTKFKHRCFDIPYSVKARRYQLRWSGTYPVHSLRNIYYTKLSDWVEVYKTEIFKRGLKGDKGAMGKQGITGAKGFKGDKGDKGDPGKDAKR
ncbi:MAG: collagen-like protein [Candidatus Woesearchaeota archaeon]